ncbi:hypothetical protein D9611_002672 [Ephemerocybe angulata]|uniref:Uncharacterized protein n=1 Tax=Ephemerocybe angulata TaxID=980116 RepID=A0A8H5C1F3_9AGAR|nr:hypothetical protein D9611_002672 [Tulosesus angulatus]
MPGIVAGSAGQRYACKCLNIRIEASTSSTAPPESVNDPAYSQVYVGDNGIAVKHTQLTLRSRQRVAHIPESNRYSRYTTLTCLVCDLPVYRIFQVVPADAEGKDGPILPADDWVEKETMKSPTGWIEVNKECLTGDAIIHTETDSSYSSLLALVVPPLPPMPIVPPEKVSPSTSEEPSAAPETPSYLSHIRALFPPPPFTPSHPAFLHLASLAEKQSQERREAAEQFIAELIQQKRDEIEAADTTLRQEVEAVWRKFRESIRKVHGDHHAAHTPRSMTRRSSSMSRERDSSRTRFARGSSPSYGTPIAIRDFVPVSVQGQGRQSHSPPPRPSQPSALSASIATSTFYHPRALRSPSPDRPRGSPDSTSSKTLSTRSGSATLVQPATTEGVNVLHFRRNVDDTINTQATYRFFVIEEEMAKDRERRQQPGKTNGSTSDNNQGTKPTTQATTSPSKATGQSDIGAQATETEVPAPPAKEDTKSASKDPPIPSRGRDPKGKRKVTFDVEPDVVTLETEETETEVAPAAPMEQQDQPDTIFELEDLDGDKLSSPRPAHALPLLEQPAISRPKRPASSKPKMKGLPESFAGLRPASLPNPSHIRAMRSPPGVDVSRSMMLSLPPAQSSPLRRGMKVNGATSTRGDGKEKDTTGELRRVAASPVDHQGTWSADGQTWRPFSRGHSVTSSVILEENEADNVEAAGDAYPTTGSAGTPRGEGGSTQKTQEIRSSGSGRENSNDDGENSPYGAGTSTAGVPGSLPVHIHLRNKPREALSLASYQPTHAMPEAEASTDVPVKPNGKPLSSSAIRKAMYAERDRTRLVDPGLESMIEEDEEDESEVENEEEAARLEALLSTTRGRRRALKILQAANQLPEAGMWRSLAS